MSPTAPAAALALGAAGLIPFVGLALAVLAGPVAWQAFWLDALARYGAVILSFVGALHWAYALKRGARNTDAWLQYGWSVIPGVFGWLTLLLPNATGLRLQAAVLVACFVIDREFVRRDPVPAWFLGLRLRLTLVAALALAGASLA